MATVDIWRWALRPDPALAAHLSPDEHARAARFVHAEHRVAFEAARGRMREILGRMLDREPRDLSFDYGPQGKPTVPGGPPFNLSHSGGCAVLAVSDGPEVGVDIEAWRDVEPGVAARYFTAAERRALAEMPFESGFFRCWTRKEAVIKADGRGLSMRLDAFDVTLDPEPALTRIDGDDPGHWHLIDLGEPAGMSGALAVRDAAGPPVLRRHAD